MEVFDAKIDGVKIIVPKIWEDERGYFYESYQKEKYNNLGINADFIQDNESYSKYGALRGLHYQLSPFAQAKLVRVLQGEVLDVIVDIRENSKTFGHSMTVILNDITKKQIFIPRGLAHGYVVLSSDAVFSYKVDNVYSKDCEAGIIYNDSNLNIDWLIPEKDFILSPKDKIHPNFGNHKT